MKVSKLIAAGKVEHVTIRKTDTLGDPAIEYRRRDGDWMFGGFVVDVIDDKYSQVSPVIADLMLRYGS